MRTFLPQKKRSIQHSLRVLEKGFTKLELAFVISIFAIMATIVLFHFKDFGSETALDNLAQDIALEIVGAQKAATSGLLTPGLLGLTAATAPSYGVFFTAGATPNTADQQFISFADIDHNGFFNDTYGGACPTTASAGNECRSVISISNGDYISNICYRSLVGSSEVSSCYPTGSSHITFTRPLHDAVMKECGSPGTCASWVNADTTYIEVSSSAGSTIQQETIIVTSLGEVRVGTGPVCTFAAVPCAS